MYVCMYVCVFHDVVSIALDAMSPGHPLTCFEKVSQCSLRAPREDIVDGWQEQNVQQPERDKGSACGVQHVYVNTHRIIHAEWYHT